ncbi:prolyl oligopeptidase family serine peptidase [Aporhodopirellula aestuarii]|uniref:prolyl oligopeptidase n=1 Tax=Aporhodopirellula aestuarii TaxID=2950107 RepID=A0ABT0U489_9BACT|nr:prolyl oligopeptidase family serine peptidase [Aporhodopirellula aestuarii]MCM2371743.1 prolyl oligopeptidase family serine peptidase [Aporhodopirellula aestuarii]
MPNTESIQYPVTATVDVVDDYHGRKVADPYRWLEDVESEETAAWVAAENEVTQAYLNQLSSRTAMREKLEALWNYSRTGLPVRRGDRYFFTHNDGLQNQGVLYVAPADTPADQLTEKRSVLIDPNSLSEDGTVALGSWHPSDDGKLLAYSIADGGSDWRTWRVRDVESGIDTDDVVMWSKFSGVAWTADGDGFYYARYAEPVEGQELTGTNENQMLYVHRLGTPQSEDTLVYSRPDEPQWGFSPTVTENERYLIIENWKGTEPKTQVFLRELDQPDAPVRPIITGFDADYRFFAAVDSVLYFLTDLDAPRRRVIAIDVEKHLADPDAMHEVDRSTWKSIIDETADTLEDVSLLGETIYASYLSDALSKVVRYSRAGERIGEFVLPGKGSASGFGGRADATETFFSFSNYVTPPSLHRVDVATGESALWLRPEVPFDATDYVTEQVFCTSKDGTRVPILISRHRDQKNDGSNRTLLYAYGGFNISLTPEYSPAIAAWLDSGGVYAVANLRGGGEYGSAWHEDGMRLKKQNVFDDFIASAEYLIETGITRSDKLAIRGGSNGGLLVGAVMTQRPELFGACLPAVGVMDMLRYHKFTIGWAWATEFGSSDEEDQIDNLLSYSPLHNIKPGTCYPATLVTTADRDDRVVPGHSFKFAAALQAAQSCGNPVLIRIESRAGHGAGTPTSKKIEEYADLWAFLIENL